MDNNKTETKKLSSLLFRIRRSTPDNFDKYLLNKLLSGLEKSGLTLKDIGSSSEELERFKLNGCLIAAREIINFILIETDETKRKIWLKELISKLTEGDIGCQDLSDS